MTRQAKLTHKTRHGMNRLSAHGPIWDILRTDPDGTLLLQSIDKTFMNGDDCQHDVRWVNRHDDKNFHVEII